MGTNRRKAVKFYVEFYGFFRIIKITETIEIEGRS